MRKALVYCVAFCVAMSFAQSGRALTVAEIDAKVKEFYQQSYVCYECGGVRGEKSVEIRFYKDSKDRIRLIQRMTHLYSSAYERAYYDESGSLMLFSKNSAPGFSKYYFCQGKVIQKEGEDWDAYKDFLTVSGYKYRDYFTEDPGDLRKSGTITFAPLNVEAYTSTLGVGVNVYKSASSKAEVIDKINIGLSLCILEIGPKEKIGDVENNWYKVSYYYFDEKTQEMYQHTGWVYGEYLLPKGVFTE